MMSDPLFYRLLLVGLVWLCLMLHVVWPYDRATARPSVPPVSRPTHTDPSRPVARHPASCPHGDGHARWTLLSTSAPRPPATMGAGSGSAISVPTDTPTAVPGDSCIAPAVAATSRRPMAHRCTASMS